MKSPVAPRQPVGVNDVSKHSHDDERHRANRVHGVLRFEKFEGVQLGKSLRCTAPLILFVGIH